MKYIAIAFVCLIVVAKVASKVAPEVGKTLRATSPEISKSEWKKNLNVEVMLKPHLKQKREKREKV